MPYPQGVLWPLAPPPYSRAGISTRGGTMRFSESLQASIDTARSHGIGDLLRRSAARRPGKLALVCGDWRETYAELDRAVNRLANALTARGIASGERVA